ncbi:MAG: hypothetical protein P4L67_05170 [Candidatus Pacebacteria bacterium]|nr:hypothetical protein [Candidatus Paceibacterota bacterium]
MSKTNSDRDRLNFIGQSYATVNHNGHAWEVRFMNGQCAVHKQLRKAVDEAMRFTKAITRDGD